MKYNKQMLTATVLSAAILGGGAFALSASAQSSPSDPGESLASKLATKFNLNKDEVKQVLNEHHTEMRAERQADRQSRVEERLTKAVTDGKITEDQKTKILEYLKTQSTFFENLRDMTEDERKSAIENRRAEVKKWASDNGIDEKYVMMGDSPGRHMGPDGPKGMRGGDDATDNSQTN